MTPTHEKLPDERAGLTHKVVIGGVGVYIRTGEYPDGRLGEVFITIDKEGSEMRLFDAIAICLSASLQRGIPLEVFTQKLKYQKLGTGGITDDSQIPIVRSILDYLARWLECKYPTPTPQERAVR